LIGSRRPLTTWTPTRRLMTGMPGITATTVATAIIAVMSPTKTGASPGVRPRPFSKPSDSETDVAGGDRQDGAGGEAGASQADAEERLGVAAGERFEGLAAGRPDRRSLSGESDSGLVHAAYRRRRPDA
jgi:hypothetical protein